MALTDIALKRAKPREKPYKLYDEKGLYVLVATSGSKLWKMRYRVEGREKKLAFGPYPEVTLAQARERCLAARATLRAGTDPGLAAEPQQIDPDRTFEAVARAWHARQIPRWKPVHADNVLDSLAADIFPMLGGYPLARITPPLMLAAIRAIEARGAVETAHRVRQRCSAVFQDAMAGGLAESDPAAVVARALAPVIKGRQPAIIDLDQARAMLAAVEAEPAYPMTKLAFRMLALTAARSTELRLMEWCEIEGIASGQPLWRVPAARMKMEREHLVPLAGPAIEVLDAVRQINTDSPLVFPSTRWRLRPLSENAFGYLLNRAGFHGKHVPHGWRATFSSVMNETHRADRAVIDLMLAHVKGDKTEAAYNRAAHLDRRRELAAEWARLILAQARPADELLGGLRKRG